MHLNDEGILVVAVWNVREDLAIACMQLGKAEEAADLVNKTVAKFPASCRAARLKVLHTNGLIDCSVVIFMHGIHTVLLPS